MNKSAALLLVAASALAAGCGSSSSRSSPSGAPTAATASAASGSPGALSAEAQSAATGDIPDNQVFLVFHNGTGGYAMKYPEGWTIQGSGKDVTIRDKNNVVHVVIAHGAAPTTSTVSSQLTALQNPTPSLKFATPTTYALPASPSAVKATYSTLSAPNAVTGKRVLLIVDRYSFGGAGGRIAIVDLGTPKGVDNVDAYRKMIQSFSWK
jgi:hypothetical protein